MNTMKNKILTILLFLAITLFSFNLQAVTEKGFKSLHIFTKVLSFLEDNYVDEVDEKKLIEGAIRGMLATLDPHTVYMSPEVFKELQVDTSGRFDGIGIEVAIRDGILTVIAPIEGTPADKAGILPGDRIIKINGTVTDEDLTNAVMQMRGRRGTKLRLTILRQDEKKPIDLSIVRQAINVPSVKYKTLEANYGYVRINSFQEGTAKALRKAIKKLGNKSNLHGLILDLRKNPGGLLDQAVEVSDLFLKQGIIVTTETREKIIDKSEATPENNLYEGPMVVLVDGGSASASEIVAGALQDNKRAVILGLKTFGKGSVQTVVELDDGSGLKLTIARYYTPSGVSIQAKGINPDVVVPAKAPKVDNTEQSFSEASLDGHLEVEKMENEQKDLSEELKKDYQMKVALDYLKSWDVFQGKQK